MGCSKSKENASIDIPAQLESLIDSSTIDSLSRFCNENKVSPQINSLKLRINSLVTNPLGYALAKGKVDSFKYLYTRMGALINEMEQVFNTQGYRSIDVLCIQGHMQMLIFYLPIYISIFVEVPSSSSKDLQETLSFSSVLTPQLPQTTFKLTPIQYACYYENINMVRYLKDYFDQKSFCYLFDIDYQDELTGENCALMTCKAGNYKMMKFLHEECKADFQALNKREENAILVLAAGSNRMNNCDYLVCLKYLISVVKIDPTYKHEEIVLLLNNFRLLDVYCEALLPYGIVPDKARLEIVNSIKSEFSEGNNDDVSNLNLNLDPSSVLSTVKIDEVSNMSQISAISALIKMSN